MEENILSKEQIRRVPWNKGLNKSDPRVRKMYEGRNSWNKGLTKETDERVKRTSISIQESWNPKNIKQRTESYRRNMMKIYGVENCFQLDSVKEKSKQTSLQKYGVDSFSKTNEYINKTKATKLAKYGNEKYNNAEKNKKTCLDRYGVSNPNKLLDVRNKIKKTNLERYGVENPYQNETIKQKVVETCLKKYGVRSVMHIPEFVEKQEKSSYKSKRYTFPSGKIITCQGYEPFALNILLKQHPENDIITGRKEIPKFHYYTEDNKKHIYYPDIFIKSINTVVETKSDWTSKLHPVTDELKKNSVLQSGYNFRKMIFNGKGDLMNDQ